MCASWFPLDRLPQRPSHGAGACALAEVPPRIRDACATRSTPKFVARAIICYRCVSNHSPRGATMKLEGLHHITMITADARANVAFYADVLGLRLVKKTVNFDAPEAYHLYFGDEQGSPGSILTWFEFAGAPRGRAGAGMIHTLQLGVDSEASLDFWAERLWAKGYASERGETSLSFEDYDGLRFELVIADDGNPPLRAEHPEV